MNDPSYERMHETTPHGDIRFHFQSYHIVPDPRWPAPISPHWHDEFEILMINGGSGTVYLNGEKSDVSSGDILFIDRGVIHALFSEEGDISFSALIFGEELLISPVIGEIEERYIERLRNGSLRFCSHIRPEDPLWEKIQPSVREICSLSEKGNELLIKSDLLRIWHFLALDGEKRSGYAESKERNNALTKEILSYIRENCRQELSLQKLAGQFHISEGQFCRLFKSHFNMTAIEYLNICRISLACSALKEENTPIGEIAVQCGYNNISYFNRTFRRYMHCTPGEYRR